MKNKYLAILLLLLTTNSFANTKVLRTLQCQVNLNNETKNSNKDFNIELTITDTSTYLKDLKTINYNSQIIMSYTNKKYIKMYYGTLETSEHRDVQLERDANRSKDSWKGMTFYGYYNKESDFDDESKKAGLLTLGSRTGIDSKPCKKTGDTCKYDIVLVNYLSSLVQEGIMSCSVD